METKIKNVLVVEDDPTHLFIAEELLKKYFNIDTVCNGHAALEAVEKKKYDVVLMDINLNDHTMDGVTAMRKIKLRPKHKHLKIIAVTASTGGKQWWIKQGFDGHCMKPLDGKGILTEILSLNDKNGVIGSFTYHTDRPGF